VGPSEKNGVFDFDYVYNKKKMEFYPLFVNVHNRLEINQFEHEIENLMN